MWVIDVDGVHHPVSVVPVDGGHDVTTDGRTLEVRSDWQTIQLDGLQCPWDVWFQNDSTFWVLNNEKMLLQYVISADDSAENEA